jgi:5-methyltetrahydropteroyltriglutamate--homocysteine methyltransferase
MLGRGGVMAASPRILTTHAGSLPKPAGLTQLFASRARGEPIDTATLAELTELATGEVIERQIATGIDILNNGEVGRESFVTYLQARMSGFGGQGQRRAMADLLRYPGYVELLAKFRGDRDNVSLLRAPQAIAAVDYASAEPIEAECRQLARLLAPHEGRYRDAFMSSPSPGIVATVMQNAFYDDLDSYVNALAKALAVEYRTIVERGFVLQIDAPDLALERHTLFADKPLAEFLEFAKLVVAAMNRSLEGIPRDRVRLHVCWGNYEGPHDLDVALADVWPVIAQVRTGSVMVALANPRHCHEYHHFEQGVLDDRAVLVPGVIDTTTNYVEHPEAVADRVLQVVRAVGDPGRVIAGTDCGFETSAGNSLLAPEIVWAKLRALSAGAALASSRL